MNRETLLVELCAEWVARLDVNHGNPPTVAVAVISAAEAEAVELPTEAEADAVETPTEADAVETPTDAVELPTEAEAVATQTATATEAATGSRQRSNVSNVANAPPPRPANRPPGRVFYCCKMQQFPPPNCPPGILESLFRAANRPRAAAPDSGQL